VEVDEGAKRLQNFQKSLTGLKKPC